MYNENNQNYYQVEEKKGNFGWAILGFLIPLVGLILFIVWKDKRKGDSKYAGIGALVGFILSLLYILVLPNLLWGSTQNSIMDSTCRSLYGSSYESLKKGSTWYCYNPSTGDLKEIE